VGCNANKRRKKKKKNKVLVQKLWTYEHTQYATFVTVMCTTHKLI
jgi:hypothetical protein